MKKIISFFLAFSLLIAPLSGVFAQVNSGDVYTFPATNGVPGFPSGTFDFTFSGSTRTFSLQNVYRPRYLGNLVNNDGYLQLSTNYQYVFFEPKKFAAESISTLYKVTLPDNFSTCQNSSFIHIFYEKSSQKIFAEYGDECYYYGRKNTKVLFENINEDTPNFMMFMRSAAYVGKSPDNERWMEYNYSYFYREKNLGSGILDREMNTIFLAGSSPINGSGLNFWASNIYVGLGVTPFGFKTPSNGSELNEAFICGGNSNFACHNHASQEIVKFYLWVWKNIFGGSYESQVNPDINDAYYNFDTKGEGWKSYIDKIDNSPPIAPECSFSDSFLGLSCLSEWIFYGIDFFRYFFITALNSIIEALNYFLNFFGSFFSFLLSVLKDFTIWLLKFLKDFFWTPIYEAFEPIISFFISLFSKIKDGEIINREFLSKQITLNCEVNYNYSITDDERQNILNIHSGSAHFFNNNFLNGIFSTFRFINPVIPSENSQICTYSGMREVTYRNNSWIDILFVMLFGFLTLLLFYRRT